MERKGCARGQGAGRSRHWVATLFLSVLAGVAAGPGVRGGDPIPPEVAAHADDWPLPNKDYASTRAVLEGEISSATVEDLTVAWSYQIPAEAVGWIGSAASNPLILGGVVYFEDLRSNVAALDLRTGAVIWEHRYNQPMAGPNGPAVGWGKVFVPKERDVAALDAGTGDELWSVRLASRTYEGIDVQPLAYGGLVLVSTVPGNLSGFYMGGTTGVIHALDQETGEIRWSFDTVDSPDIWGNPAVNSGGGAWYPPAVDLGRGLTFWGTGNPAPWPGTPAFPNGSSRPGPNLYTNCVLALDHASGELAWHHQVRPHDLFDLDFQLTPIVTRAAIGGKERDVVLGGGKTGTVLAFDLETGERLWEAVVGRHQNDHLEEVPPGQTVEVFPGALGGVETPMALAGGVVYAPIVNLASRYTSTAHLGGTGSLMDGTGEVAAIDAASGQVLWTRELETMAIGAATVVNDLVFTATYGGRVYALDRATGEVLWSTTAPGRINGFPAVADDYLLIPVGFGSPPVLLGFTLGPHVDFTVTPEGGEAPLEVQVDASASTPREGHPIVSYTWDFGDGTMGEGKTASHLYSQGGRYAIRLTVADDRGATRVGKTRTVTVRCASAMAAPWSSEDVGEAPYPGAALWEAGEGSCLVVCAGGEHISGPHDHFHFVHQELRGDLALTARIDAMSPPRSAAYAGLMVRESLDPASRHAAVLFRKPTLGASGARFVYRETPGDSSQGGGFSDLELGAWLRIERRGGEVIGSVSADGKVFSELGRAALELPQAVLAGVAAVGNDPGAEDRSFTPLTAEVCGLEVVSTPGFLRGDCDGSGQVTGSVTDGVFLLRYNFVAGGRRPPCLAACDANGDGTLGGTTDAIVILRYNFLGGPPPVAPYPECGPGERPTDLELGCDEPSCPPMRS